MLLGKACRSRPHVYNVTPPRVQCHAPTCTMSRPHVYNVTPPRVQCHAPTCTMSRPHVYNVTPPRVQCHAPTCTMSRPHVNNNMHAFSFHEACSREAPRVAETNKNTNHALHSCIPVCSSGGNRDSYPLIICTSYSLSL